MIVSKERAQAGDLDATRWERIQELFHRAADLPGEEQRSLLESECGADVELRGEVLAMLEEDARNGALLERDLTQLASQALNECREGLEGRVFGPYRIQRLLGEGGMGVVYLAERTDLGTLVAIKILRDAALSPLRRERFQIEQKTLAQLNHPAIARLYDAGTLSDGTPWFVMEYVEGVAITSYCREKQCTVQERLGLLRPVCEAVQYAHAHLVIHRDLKPSNILVKPDGSVRLLDFGIAKQLDLEGPANQTRTGLRLMTPAYAAPEQVRGGRLGTHTDVYALGVVLYELLTGQLPHDLLNRTPAEVDAAITGEDAERPSAVVRRRTGPSAMGKREWADLDVLCLTAMHKDIARRYQTPDALMRDIDHYLKGEPLEARADSWAYRTGKFVTRNRRMLAAAALIVAAVVGMVVFFTLRLERAKDAALAQAQRAQRIQDLMMNMFDQGDKLAGPAQRLRAVDVLDRGVKQADMLKGEPEVQAELYQTLGNAFRNLGQFGKAEALLRSANEQFRRTTGAESWQFAGSEVALGLTEGDEGRLADAEKMIRGALAIAERRRTPDPVELARVNAALGEILEMRGELGKAIAHEKKAVDIQSKVDSHKPDYANYLNSLGVMQFDLDHFDEARKSLKQALGLSRSILGPEHPFGAEVLMNLASVDFQQARWAEAERGYRAGIDIVRTWYGDGHSRLGDMESLLGQTVLREGRPATAAEILRKALAVQERAYGENNQRVAQTYNALAASEEASGQFSAAEEDFEQSIRVSRAVLGDQHYFVAIAMGNLARVYRLQGEFARAESLNREALGRLEKVLPPDHGYVCVSMISLGRTLLAEKRYRDAEPFLSKGYWTLSKQAGPSSPALKEGRDALAVVYQELHEPEKAAALRGH